MAMHIALQFQTPIPFPVKGLRLIQGVQNSKSDVAACNRDPRGIQPLARPLEYFLQRGVTE